MKRERAIGLTPKEQFAANWERIRGDTSDLGAWVAFISLFARTGFNDKTDIRPFMDVLLACLAQDAVDVQVLADTALRLFRLDPQLGPLLEVAERDDPERLRRALAEGDLPGLLDRRVVLLALTRVVHPSMAFERLFAQVRRALALRCAAGEGVPVEAACALARQGFVNGYVWCHGEDEVAAVEGIAAALNSRPLEVGDMGAIAIMGAYLPLWSWDRLEDAATLSGQEANPWFAGVVRQQILEPMQELALSEHIPVVGLTDSPVSAAVREQYEEHPYPRWTAVNVNPEASVHGGLRAALGGVDVPFRGSGTKPDVLVAGCGTGRQLAQVAKRWPGARVTGLDLSLASLSYAARRCGELGFEGVSLAQADILALDGWEQSFDIIDCGGVLHHMEDPMEGWRILRKLLRPGGLMRIALYSEVARRGVVQARAFIEKRGYPADPEGIRVARPMLARHFESADGGVLAWRDFYSMEECRDLLFHVQEHRFTLPEIESILDRLELDFQGFELSDLLTRPAFTERFPGPGMTRSLEAWHAFEEERPDTFRGMYQFWVSSRR